ncbi:ABC transporter ATP-binding protein [Clostridia bacterium]|nr:ABC transporter ATP-binding protein [Clostridia bacterium]
MSDRIVETLVEARRLSTHFPLRAGFKRKAIRAVDDVSFTIRRGETLGFVGESGCGKTTLGRTLLRMQEPTSGQIVYNGEDITSRQMLPYRRKMQFIFQDPFASLDPRMTVGDTVGEPLDIFKLHNGTQDRRRKINELLETVGLTAEHANRFPHEFSGGQRQRIGIARALAVGPEFIVCDEPISALDVSIRAQIINMLMDLQREKGLTYLFIAHDLAVVRHISSRVGVMYLGRLIELTSSAELYRRPLHPYTQSLLSAIPIADPDRAGSRPRMTLTGEIPSPTNPPSGCAFRTRCPQAMESCALKRPELMEVAPGHSVACLRVS